ncbi:MAG: NifU family protein [Alphaproteobacteria bacterium]|nr:MAG: NifU family protein [Alphaproteobacteria bacterium]
MFIQTEDTPNPATVKFIPGQQILASGTLDFASQGDASRSPLAARLFGLVGVARVFLSADFVSVSKADDTDWSMLKPMILAVLMEHLSTKQPILDEGFYSEEAPAEEDDEITKQIKELLDERVRPMVAMDGGDIVFERFEDGIVYLQMRGACSGCPSSTATLKVGIENMLRHYIPEVQEVRPSAEY